MPRVPCLLQTPHWPQAAAAGLTVTRAGSSGGSGHSCPTGGQAPYTADAVVLERDFPGVPQEGLLEGGKVGFVF